LESDGTVVLGRGGNACSGAVLSPVEDPKDDHIVPPGLISDDKAGLAETHLRLSVAVCAHMARKRIGPELSDHIEDRVGRLLG